MAWKIQMQLTVDIIITCCMLYAETKTKMHAMDDESAVLVGDLLALQFNIAKTTEIR